MSVAAETCSLLSCLEPQAAAKHAGHVTSSSKRIKECLAVMKKPVLNSRPTRRSRPHNHRLAVFSEHKEFGVKPPLTRKSSIQLTETLSLRLLVPIGMPDP